MKNRFTAAIHQQIGLEECHANLLWQLGQLKSYPPSTILARPGQFNSRAFFIDQGICCFYKPGKRQDKIILNFKYAPCFLPFDPAGFFINATGDHYCEALTEMSGVEFEGTGIFSLAEHHPHIYQSLARLITNIDIEAENKAICMIEKTSAERYIEFTSMHPFLTDHVPLKFLASYLQIRPGSLSRIRKELKSNR